MQKYNDFFNRLYNNIFSDNKAKDQKEKMELVKKYLERQKRVEDKVISSDRESDVKMLKNFYYDKYIIKLEDVPESYFELQKRIAKERGFGDIEITPSMREEMGLAVINDQKKSLDTWLDYFFSEDSKFYPYHLKYWAFQGMLALGGYDKEKEEFRRRSKNTTNIFVDLNREALALTINAMNDYLNGNVIEDKEQEKLLEKGIFGKLYSYYITKVNSIRKDSTNSNDGIWIKYDRGSDHMSLVKSLEGRGTGWCTAGESTAKSQLQNGDFYIYYTKDSENKYTVPRIAIRMEENSIGEIRGIAEHQNIESDMEKVVEEKLKEFPDRDKYNKKVSDMKKMTDIYNKYKNNIELSKEELTFLYEIEKSITGFGYQKDPRIEEILSTRDKKKDLSLILNCRQEQIALGNEKINEDTIYAENVENNFNLENLKNLRMVGKNADFNNLTFAEGLKKLKSIGQNAYFINLTSAKGLENLKSIGGFASFLSLELAKGLENLTSIGRGVYFCRLISAEGLEGLTTIGGYADFSSLTSAKGLENLTTIGGYADFSSLTSAKGLENLTTIGGYADFSSLTSAKGLENLTTIGGYADFSSLISAEGLENLTSIGVSAKFNHLTSIKGLENVVIKRDAYFDSLIDISELDNLHVEGNIYVNGEVYVPEGKHKKGK